MVEALIISEPPLQLLDRADLRAVARKREPLFRSAPLNWAPVGVGLGQLGAGQVGPGELGGGQVRIGGHCVGQVGSRWFSVQYHRRQS